MRTLSRVLLAGACALALPASALAASHATSTQAKAMLDRAVAELGTAGPDKALAEFDQPKGAFNTGELYVFVLSMNGVYEAYGANPTLVGKNVIDLKDAAGKPIVRRMIDIASHAGHGKLDYVWLNRSDNRVEHKWSLIQRVGNHIVGVGYYPN